MRALVRRSWRRSGRLAPLSATIRSRAIRLAPGEAVDWHSTKDREELLLVLSGVLSLELDRPGRTHRVKRLGVGATIYLPSHVTHRVRNASRRPLVYVYVTAPHS